ncbi:MAG: thiamine phosphate synthase [Pirellulales bacterium]
MLQSLRVLEETTKLGHVELSGQFKQLRYRAYDQLAEVERHLTVGSHFLAPRLYLLIDCSTPNESFLVRRFSDCAQAGVGLFQLRDKRADGALLLSYAKAAVEAVGTDCVIVNDRVDIALASGVGGVHVGQEDLSIQIVRQLTRGTNLKIGVSTHNIEQALQAQRDGADYIGCGPTFPSTTKQFSDFAGLDFLRQVVERIEIPAYAIGGINAENLQQVLHAGFRRVAVSGAVLNAESPEAAADEISKMLVANCAD